MATLKPNSLSGKYPVLEFVYPNLQTGYKVQRTVQIVGENDHYLEGFELSSPKTPNQFKRYLKNKVVGDIRFVRMEVPVRVY